jgi:hypothetical protein
MDHTLKNVLNTLLQTQVSYADLEFVTLLPLESLFVKKERKRNKQVQRGNQRRKNCKLRFLE